MILSPERVIPLARGTSLDQMESMLNNLQTDDQLSKQLFDKILLVEEFEITCAVLIFP
jgi:hypothetical protein